MFYCETILQINNLRDLRNAFLSCSCIKDPKRRSGVYEALKSCSDCDKISVYDDNVQDWMEQLIRQCQNYKGALENLLDIVADREGNSKNMKNLTISVTTIFGFWHDNKPEIYYLRKQDQIWVVTFDDQPSINFQDIFSDYNVDIQQERQRISIWKHLHTLCEQLAKEYLLIYKFFYQTPNLDTISTLESFKQKQVLDFCRKLNGVINTQKFDFAPINYLVSIESCIDALIHSIRHGTNYPHSSYYQMGIEFSEFIINDLLFGSLRLADRILQEHFDNQQSQETEEN